MTTFTTPEQMERYLCTGEGVPVSRQSGGHPLPLTWQARVGEKLFEIPDTREMVLYSVITYEAADFVDPHRTSLDLINKIAEDFGAQLAGQHLRELDAINILRDPYSAKPYVLFYVSCKVRVLA